ncbi:MAG: hypothetical protein ACI4D0_10380 [Lachnospira sp.]
MMEDNKTIFNYIGQVFATYGMILFIFIIFGSLIGDIASGYSSLFELGNQGFSIATLLQLFVLAFIITVAQVAFLTDRWIKNLSLFFRNVLFFGIVVVTIVIFVILFGWFPIDDLKSWIGFVLSFVVCTAIGVTISRMEEQAENRKMEQALNKIKNKK